MASPLTLDQLRVFLRAADLGSFSAAGRVLGRAQSAVSYSIANLERLFGVPLFDRASRVPILTEAGRALLVDARAIVGKADELGARARGIASGVEPRLNLAVSVLFPMPELVAAVGEFTQAFPSVLLALQTEMLGAVAQSVLDGVCQLGICEGLPKFPPDLDRKPLTQIEMVYVAAANHPLARLKGPISARTLDDHVQLVVSDRSRLTAGIDLGVLGARTWRLADLETKHAFLRAGFGWGSMPVHRVREDVAEGVLKPIVLADATGAPSKVTFFAIFRTERPPGRAGQWLLAKLRENLASRGTSEISRPRGRAARALRAHGKS
jgi:DNA-binding transcriptional LysR family regulator